MESEWRNGRVRSSLNASFLPPWSFEERIMPLVKQFGPEKEIYVICLSAHRSIGALKYLKAKGYSNVFQLAGGMKEWRRQKMPEESDIHHNNPDSRFRR
jgi:rhodanese-related sulfurtransferase